MIFCSHICKYNRKGIASQFLPKIEPDLLFDREACRIQERGGLSKRFVNKKLMDAITDWTWTSKGFILRDGAQSGEEQKEGKANYCMLKYLGKCCYGGEKYSSVDLQKLVFPGPKDWITLLSKKDEEATLTRFREKGLLEYGLVGTSRKRVWTVTDAVIAPWKRGKVDHPSEEEEDSEGIGQLRFGF